MTSPGGAETGDSLRQAWKIVDQSFVAQGQFRNLLSLRELQTDCQQYVLFLKENLFCIDP
jgi:hypothetical protein